MASDLPALNALRRAKEHLVNAPASPEEKGLIQPVLREVERALASLESIAPRASPLEAAQRRDLLSTVCHDLKDPLASIVMGAGFLRKVLPQDDAMAPARRVVEAIHRSAERMNQLVLDFHDLAKLEAGQLKSDLYPTDASSLVKSAVDQFAAKAREKGIGLVNATPANFGERVLCDRARVLQVLSKLIGNAVKFTDSGMIRVGAEAVENGIRFSVSDTGRGIVPERVETIFDRIANASVTPREGTGIGLPLARGLIRLQGGELSAESEPGRGSTFSFTLRRAT